MLGVRSATIAFRVGTPRAQMCKRCVRRSSTRITQEVEIHAFSPNVKDEPRRRLARSVRQHDP
jgi:hypothetical protein